MKTDNNFFITHIFSINSKSTNSYKNIIDNKSKINIIPNYKNNQKEEKEILNENFFDYLINNQANYAKFENVIEYYEKKIYKNKKKINENVEIIKKKKQEIQNLKNEINNNICNNIILTNRNLDIYYLNLFEQIKKNILFQEHQLEIYKKQFNDIYKMNYKLNYMLEKENKLLKISNEQYDKYLNIKTTSLSKMLKQEEMLKTLNNYFSKCQQTNEELRTQRMEKIKKLDYEVYLLKKDEIKFDKSYEEIKEKNNIINKIILEKQNQYNILINDYKYIVKSYFRDKNYMNQIYDLFGIIDVENIIKTFKKLTQKYNELSLNFVFKSRENLKLNEELTNLNKEYENVHKSIKNKKNIKNETNKIINHKVMFEKLKTKIQKYKNLYSEKYESFQNKIEMTSKCVSLILRLLDKIMNSPKNIDIFNINEDDRFIKLKKYRLYYKENIKDNKKINYDQVLFNKNYLKFLVFIFNELNYRIKIAISNAYNIIYKKDLNNENNNKTQSEFEIEEKKSNKDLNIENGNKTNIYPFETEKFEKIFKNELKIIQDKLEEKINFFKRNEKNIKENINSKEKKDEYNLPLTERKNNNMEYISKKDFLYNYYLHYKKTILKNIPHHNNNIYKMNKSSINNENTSSNLYNNSSRYNDIENKINLNKFNFAINYTNEFVSDKITIEEKKKEKKERILKKSKKIKEDLEEEEFLKYLKKSRKKKSVLKHYHSQDDISVDSNELGEKEKIEELRHQFIHDELIKYKKEKNYHLKYENPEIEKISNRNEDIKALELNFYKNKKNFILDSSFFNEYYFQLKKKFKENRMKINLRKKFLKSNKEIFYKTIIDHSSIDKKLKLKKYNNNKLSGKKKKYKINNNNNSVLITMRNINRNIFHKNNSLKIINNSSIGDIFFNKSKSKSFRGINKRKYY